MRPKHRKQHPVHVVLRMRKDVPRLRQGKTFAAIRRALRTIQVQHAFRVVHLSIQHNHVHLLAEAEDKLALSRGVQALAIATAKWINKACARTGKVFAHRYHATEITSPRQARNALAYVLNNWRRHHEDLANERARLALVDPYSSGLSFDGWALHGSFAIPDGYEPFPVSFPQTWLLQSGWKRYPPIGVAEVPGMPSGFGEVA